MSTRIQLRRGTAAAWTSANPVLAVGEPGLETDTGLQKIGDGSTAWAALAYAAVQLPASVVSASPTGGIPAWVTGTVYKVNTLVSNSGTNYICNTANTAGATFGGDAAKWTALGSGGGVSVVQMDSGTAPTVDHATALVDQAFTYYDQASGKLKGRLLTSIAGFGSVVAKVASYGVASGDANAILTFNGSGLTATLPAVAPNSPWAVTIVNLNASTLTVSPNGLTLNSVAGSITLATNQWATVWSDGANYEYGQGGPSSGGSSVAWAADVPTIWGQKAGNFSPMFADTTTSEATGYLLLMRVDVEQSFTIANINWWLGSAGATLTSSECYAGVYSVASGNLIGLSGDLSGASTGFTGSVGYQSVPVSVQPAQSLAVAAGAELIVALLAVGTTVPTFGAKTMSLHYLGSTGQGGGGTPFPFSGSNAPTYGAPWPLYARTGSAGFTSLPSTLTTAMSSGGGTWIGNGKIPWIGLS